TDARIIEVVRAKGQHIVGDIGSARVAVAQKCLHVRQTEEPVITAGLQEVEDSRVIGELQGPWHAVAIARGIGWKATVGSGALGYAYARRTVVVVLIRAIIVHTGVQ